MRVIKTEGAFRAKAISGTHTVLIALDCADQQRTGLMGFAFKREVVGAGDGGKWLRSLKVFKSLVPDPKNARDPQDPTKPARFSTWDHPIQSFLWSDYTAEPDTAYRFTVVPMYGEPGALQPRTEITFEIRTVKTLDRGHGVWFNRGAIASQAFAREFGNKAPTEVEVNDPGARVTQWLSRGLLDACLDFIDRTPSGDGLRVAAYEFTYPPVLRALRAALDRGVDVRIVYDDTKTSAGADGENEKSILKVQLPRKLGRKQVLFPRTKPKIPHNKFIVRLAGGTVPTQVWTGSTNFTPSGFLGQTNVGHLVDNVRTAKQYLALWKMLSKDPALATARTATMKLTPDPAELIGPNSVVQIFSPRPKSDLLKWYGRRVTDAAGSVMFTAAFGVTKTLVAPLAKDRDFLRFILMEKPPTKDVKKALSADRDCVTAYGAVLGEMYEFKDGKPTARKRIRDFELDKWLLVEDHYRRHGFVFFVHTKFLLIDPLSDDPLVCTGSANFSPDSLLQNDENMLLIRGDTRVADIYLTEFDRLFRHFYFRDVANEIEARGGQAQGAFLDETKKWTDRYFAPGAFKTRRREMFFADPQRSWVDSAGRE
jgi:phosphatidylserine/phosphatidylglycerophosphate/cardiolipin synthase-like enzyme